MPVASTPTTRRAASGEAAASPMRVTSSWVRRPVTGVSALDRVSRRDLDLGAQGPLALDDMARDVLGEILDEELPVDHDLVDRLLEELGEAGHVHALLRGVEIDEAVDLGRDQGVPAAVLHPHRLLHARHARRARARSVPRAPTPAGLASAVTLSLHAPTVAREQMPDDERFAQLVRSACHDLRTPLAVVSGFAKTLGRTELEPPGDRHVEMIVAASDAARGAARRARPRRGIEGGRFEPQLDEVDSLELARAAAAELDRGPCRGRAARATVRVPEEETRRALRQLARAASRHGGIDSVELAVDGRDSCAISPITALVGPVLLGEDAASSARAASSRRALGGSSKPRTAWSSGSLRSLQDSEKRVDHGRVRVVTKSAALRPQHLAGFTADSTGLRSTTCTSPWRRSAQ